MGSFHRVNVVHAWVLQMRCKSGLWQGAHRVLPKPLFCYLDCVLVVVVLLKSSPEDSRARYHIGCLCTLLHYFPPPSIMLPSPCFTVVMPGYEHWLVYSRRDTWHSSKKLKSLFHHPREFCFPWSQSLSGVLCPPASDVINPYKGHY